MQEKWRFSARLQKQQGNSFALYKMPGSADVHCIVSASPTAFSYNFIEGQQGFAFVPFDTRNHPGTFLTADKYYLNPEIEESTLADFYLGEEITETETDESYLQNVRLSVEEIKSGRMQKTVIAKNALWTVPQEFSPTNYFKKLCEVYPEAFVSLVSVKDTGTWIGATPEYLLKVTAEHLMTVALAGTQLKDSSQWSDKESEEQLWVVKYIEELINNYQPDTLDVSARRRIQNGPLEHLYTEIKFSKSGIENTKLAAQVLPALHPTPAVCGLPKQDAMDFILSHEKFQRSYYSGFLGPVNINNQSNLFVNLRCMQVLPNGLMAYAGAGITKDSIPEKELQETHNKMQNLKRWLS